MESTEEEKKIFQGFLDSYCQSDACSAERDTFPFRLDNTSLTSAEIEAECIDLCIQYLGLKQNSLKRDEYKVSFMRTAQRFAHPTAPIVNIRRITFIPSRRECPARLLIHLAREVAASVSDQDHQHLLWTSEASVEAATEESNSSNDTVLIEENDDPHKEKAP
ncbi:hypothetical protein CAPTEDRAFT_206939, partial [Capitella teleta]